MRRPSAISRTTSTAASRPDFGRICPGHRPEKLRPRHGAGGRGPRGHRLPRALGPDQPRGRLGGPVPSGVARPRRPSSASARPGGQRRAAAAPVALASPRLRGRRPALVNADMLRSTAQFEFARRACRAQAHRSTSRRAGRELLVRFLRGKFRRPLALRAMPMRWSSRAGPRRPAARKSCSFSGARLDTPARTRARAVASPAHRTRRKASPWPSFMQLENGRAAAQQACRRRPAVRRYGRDRRRPPKTCSFPSPARGWWRGRCCRARSVPAGRSVPREHVPGVPPARQASLRESRLASWPTRQRGQANSAGHPGHALDAVSVLDLPGRRPSPAGGLAARCRRGRLKRPPRSFTSMTPDTPTWCWAGQRKAGPRAFRIAAPRRRGICRRRRRLVSAPK